MLLDFFWIVYLYLRPIIKWFLHRFTRLGELQRIVYGAPTRAKRSKEVEISLNLSRNLAIRELITDLDYHVQYCNDSEFDALVYRALSVVMTAKKIKPQLHPDFPRIFKTSIRQIWGYKRLMHVIEHVRTEQYDSDNLEHEGKLLDLWRYLMPDVQLTSRISKQWQDIGFQGDDPKTDFRGMGLLGLENLLYFAREYTRESQHVLLHSHHPNHGYTFAIVGINITSMAYNLYKSGKAKTHFFNITDGAPTLEHFHKFYCYLFFEFDRFWVESKPRNIMDFSIINEKFRNEILSSLEDDSTCFKMNFVITDV